MTNTLVREAVILGSQYGEGVGNRATSSATVQSSPHTKKVMTTDANATRQIYSVIVVVTKT